MLLQIDSFLLLGGIETFFGHQFSVWHSTKLFSSIFTVPRIASHGLSYRNLSVCPSVTLVDCVHIVRPTIMISSPYGNPIILVSGDINFIPKFEGDHPERGR